jgi:hypothetical protein
MWDHAPSVAFEFAVFATDRGRFSDFNFFFAAAAQNTTLQIELARNRQLENSMSTSRVIEDHVTYMFAELH